MRLDLRAAFRSIARSPGFLVSAVVTSLAIRRRPTIRSAARSYQHIATCTIGSQNLSGNGQSSRVDIEFVSR